MDNREKQEIHLSWEPGMELSSEEEYQVVTSRLADELLRDYTPEQLAKIAAQHVIYVDALTGTNNAIKNAAYATTKLVEIKSQELQLMSMKNDFITRSTANFARLVLDAKNKKRAQTAAIASHKLDREGKAAALAEWDTNGHKYSCKRAFARKTYTKYGVQDFMTVYRWLLEHGKLKP